MRDIDAIPLRPELINRIRQANRVAVPWIIIQFALAIVIASGIDWERIVNEPLLAVIAVLIIVGPQFMGVLRHYATNKREIGNLKEHTKFGEFDKYRLRFLMDDTLERLGLPKPGPPVYITADKSLNAGALHLGFGGFFRSLNGVYLNRQILHHLTPEEVQDIIGHELGHFYRYYLLSQRFHGLTVILGALSALWVTQRIGMSSAVSVVALTFCGSLFHVVSNWLVAKNAISIEYLCDDLGAQVHGIAVSINGLLKLGVHSEMQLAIQHQQLSSLKHGNLNTRDVVEAIEAAIPYGHTSRDELERAVADSLKRRSQDHRNLSVGRFLEFAWKGDDDEDAVEEMIEKLDRAQKAPRLNWESLLDRPGHIALNEDQILRLVHLIATNPDQVLFRSPEELGDGDGIHPPGSSRILYLWKNRNEIATART